MFQDRKNVETCRIQDVEDCKSLVSISVAYLASKELMRTHTFWRTYRRFLLSRLRVAAGLVQRLAKYSMVWRKNEIMNFFLTLSVIYSVFLTLKTL